MTSPFYDNYVERQIKSGINNRIYGLYKRLLKIGLHSNQNILEIGCGIGALTYLLSKKVKTGAIEAVDFSEKSVSYAASNIRSSNILFTSCNILDYKTKAKNFDYILLFDVLEHIPQEKHQDLFSRISNWMHTGSLLFINIPNPDYILYEQKKHSRDLQEIDQPIYFHQLADVLQRNQLQINKMETYSVWVKSDYQFYVIQKQNEFHEQFIEKKLLQKINNRINLKLRRFIHRYPV